MYWKYNNTGQIETKLFKENITLKKLMDEDGILNECKVQNKALINFLIKPEILEELVTLTTTEPSGETDELNRFKYPNIACELLTCDIPPLNERLAGDKALLNKLYSFLDSDEPLNPLLSSFFSKIMAVLIAKRPEQNWLSYQLTCLQVLDFLKAKENFVSLLLKHIGTSAIMDFTLKLMSQVGGVQLRQNILGYLDDQKMIQSLIGLLRPNEDSDKHHNVAQLLCDFHQLARDNQRHSTETNDPDLLLNTLEMPETVDLLLDVILGEEKSESGIVSGIQIILELLDANKSSIPKYEFANAYDENYQDLSDGDCDRQVVESTTRVILKRLKDFHKLLLDPPKRDPIVTTFGELKPPLGNTRLQIIKLLAVVIGCGGPEIAQELVSLGTMNVLLDLFFAFPWNNFLHAQVQACIAAALNSPLPTEQGDNVALSKHLLVDCKLVDRILDAWNENENRQTQNKGVRQGYMGHLINIANNVVNLCTEGPLTSVLKDNLPELVEKLQTFKEGPLTETNKKQESWLAGLNPHVSNDESSDYSEIPFPQSEIGEQNFNEYQMQQLNSNFCDTYGYSDDEFKDGDDTLNIKFRSVMNFDLSEGDLVHQHELFKQVCAQNINTLDDAEDQIFEDKEHTFQTVIEKDVDRNSDSDDEGSPRGDDPLMEVEPWNSSNRPSEAASFNSENPWYSTITDVSNATGWADFSSAFDADFESVQFNTNGSPKVATSTPPRVEGDLSVESIDGEQLVENNSVNFIEVSQVDGELGGTVVIEQNPSEVIMEEVTGGSTVVVAAAAASSPPSAVDEMITTTANAATENNVGAASSNEAV
ncbi:PREDICTED: serine/threonine-protein phosphatase 6 regulatory subunit 3-like isoform X2 [Nicrophorus vespilloides]|uniref:Serine/threonine-protein phosphatase 6 regulatory subunit 3-like isoform X2 n=1 Tax=Nicrophorus vespilloides TaxID=110193 RepID=A0ABM1MGE8_NICVS|nr:PREDICTED: serine/threonine-protein phosphatase 6 regulatory subunit 3-like isoform X2 [Nicrophorus vespilloides]